ncbi:MAG: TlpA family protein disulfide reductase [Chloroflexi bacterium]|nr:TlpA family protein disulfide reductase [Chloroflexota bacterium]
MGTGHSFFRAWMVLLILPIIGIIGMVLMITSDDTHAPRVKNTISDRVTPVPQTFIPPTPPTATAQPSIIDQPAPALELTTLDGQPFHVQDYAGQRIVLNFWASWCVPCVDEMPELQKYSDAQGKNGVRVIAVTDPNNGQTLADVQKFLVDHDLTLEVGLDQEMAYHYAMGVFALPLTYLIDETGVVRAYLIGQLTADRLNDEITRVFGPNPS